MNDTLTTDSDRRGSRAMFTVVRARRVTCRWCADPTTGFTACRRCTAHHRTAGVADVIAPLVYAIAGTESAALLRDYKNHPSGAFRRACADGLASLVETALPRHEDCLAARVGMPITVRTTIPSLTFRPGVHPLTTVVRAAGVPATDVLEAAPSATCHRTLSAGKFAVASAAAVSGRHVLILDDIWTPGSRDPGHFELSGAPYAEKGPQNVGWGPSGPGPAPIFAGGGQSPVLFGNNHRR